jgi:hypothetical protein
MSCSPFGCTGTTCATTCNGNTPCHPGYYCWHHWTGNYCRQAAELDSFSVAPPGPVAVGSYLWLSALAHAASPALPPGQVDTVLYRYVVQSEGRDPQVACNFSPSTYCGFRVLYPGLATIRVEVKNATSPQPFDDADEYVLEVTP